MTRLQALLSPPERFTELELRILLGRGHSPEEIFDQSVSMGMLSAILYLLMFPLVLGGVIMAGYALVFNTHGSLDVLSAPLVILTLSGLASIGTGCGIGFALLHGERRPTAGEIAQRRSVLAAYCRNRLMAEQTKAEFLTKWASCDGSTVSAAA